MEPNIVTVEQVAALLDISSQTVRKYVKFGLIKATKVGRKWVVSGEELARILKEGITFQP